MKSNDTRLAYFAGVKVGIEVIERALESISDKDSNLLSIDCIHEIVSKSLQNIENKLESESKGAELLQSMNDYLKEM